MKFPKKTLFSILKFVFVFAVVTAWIFSPFAHISFRVADKEITLGPKTKEVHAASIVIAPSDGVNDTTVGVNDWKSPARVVADDGSLTHPAKGATGVSNYLRAKIGDVSSIPGGAVIEGIEITYNRWETDAAYNVFDSSIRLYKNGAYVGDNKADTLTEWPTANTSTVTYGGPNDLWGTTWTRDDVLNMEVGLSIDITGSGSFYARVDYAEFTIYYSPYSISGNLYSDEGTTLFTAGKTIALYAATTTPSAATTTTSDGSGAFSFTDVEGIAAGIPMSLWVDGDTNTRAFTLTKASSTASITNADLYQNRIIAKHEGFTGTSTTITDFAQYDRDDDSDIQFIANGGTLETMAGQMLYVAPGSEFAPGGAVTTHGNASKQIDGDLKLAYGNRQDGVATSSIFSPYTSAVSLGGSLFASTSAIFNSLGTTTFAATTTGKSIYASSTSLFHVDFNGTNNGVSNAGGGGWTLQEMATTTGNFLITTGTTTAPSTALEIQGNFRNDSYFSNNSGTTTFTGTTTQYLLGSIASTSAFHHLDLNNSFGGNSVIFSDNASSTNAIISQGTVQAPPLFSVGGNYRNDGTFTANSGTTTFDGTSQQWISGLATGTSAFAGLEFTNISASTTFWSAASSTGLMSATPGARIEFASDATTTAQNISFAGTNGNEIYLHSSAPGTAWGFDVPGDRSVTYVNVKDSNACSGEANISATVSTDGGNNTCWDITGVGTLAIADHAAGQESDKFNTSVLTNEEFFAFKMTPTNEAITATLVFDVEVSNLTQSDITNVQLFPDYNGNGAKDTDDAEDPVGGSGTVSITGVKGTITFSSFSTSTAMNYILEADIANIAIGSEFFIRLNKDKITATGDTSASSITPTGTVSSVLHSRSGGGTIGAAGRVGDTTTADAVQTGGGGGGGESLGDDNDNKAPSSSGTPANFWSSGGNGTGSDDSYASETTAGEGLNFNSFGFNVPSGDTINGIEVKVEASCVTTCGSIDIALTWDNDGTNATTTAKNTGTLTTTDTIYTLGDSTDTWGRSWSASEFTDANFSVEVSASPSGANAVQIDAVTARVYHQATGGGGGGGGRSQAPPSFFAQFASLILSLGSIISKIVQISLPSLTATSFFATLF